MSLQKLKPVYFLGSFVNSIKGIYNKVNEIIDYLNGEGPNFKYKIYVAQITQNDTEAPIAVILENTIGEIVWSYVDIGIYKGTLIGAFKNTKTIVSTPALDSDFGAGAGYVTITVTENEIYLYTYNTEGNLFNQGLFNSSLEIKVYN